ncbi:hypothetical protein V6N13_064218 [Hibiscus sabdariffa]
MMWSHTDIADKVGLNLVLLDKNTLYLMCKIEYPVILKVDKEDKDPLLMEPVFLSRASSSRLKNAGFNKLSSSMTYLRVSFPFTAKTVKYPSLTSSGTVGEATSSSLPNPTWLRVGPLDAETLSPFCSH